MVSAAELGRLCRSGRYYDAVITAQSREKNSFLQASPKAKGFYLVDMTVDTNPHVVGTICHAPPASSLSVGFYAVGFDLLTVWRIKADRRTGKLYWCRLDREGREAN